MSRSPITTLTRPRHHTLFSSIASQRCSIRSDPLFESVSTPKDSLQHQYPTLSPFPPSSIPCPCASQLKHPHSPPLCSRSILPLYSARNQSILRLPSNQPFQTTPGPHHLQPQQTSAKQTAYSNAIIRQRTMPTICTGSDLSTRLCNSTVDTHYSLFPTSLSSPSFPSFPFPPRLAIPTSHPSHSRSRALSTIYPLLYSSYTSSLNLPAAAEPPSPPSPKFPLFR